MTEHPHYPSEFEHAPTPAPIPDADTFSEIDLAIQTLARRSQDENLDATDAGQLAAAIWNLAAARDNLADASLRTRAHVWGRRTRT